MRTSKLTVCFVTLCTLAAPALATPVENDRSSEQQSITRKPASAAELDAYGQREKAAAQLEKFEGGRGGTIEITTLIIILLVVILILILI